MSSIEPVELCRLSGQTHWSSPVIRQIYEQSFPAAEAMPPTMVATGIQQGRLNLHVTSVDGKPACLSVHRQLAPDISWLIFLATASSLRSRGIGSQHMQKLQELIAEENGAGSSIVFEIESTRARHLAELTAEERYARLARRRFYARLGAHLYHRHYEMLPFVSGEPTTPAHIMWFGPRRPRQPIRHSVELIYNCGLFPSVSPSSRKEPG